MSMVPLSGVNSFVTPQKQNRVPSSPSGFNSVRKLFSGKKKQKFEGQSSLRGAADINEVSQL